MVLHEHLRAKMRRTFIQFIINIIVHCSLVFHQHLIRLIFK